MGSGLFGGRWKQGHSRGQLQEAGREGSGEEVGRGALGRQHHEGWWCGVGEGEPLLAKVLLERLGLGEGRGGDLGLWG